MMMGAPPDFRRNALEPILFIIFLGLKSSSMSCFWLLEGADASVLTFDF